MEFTELHLSKAILKAIGEENYKKPTLVQEKVIPLVLDKKDVIASAQTGTGKTAAFALPILQLLSNKKNPEKKGKKIKALVVSPTRELALQIEQNFNTYSRYTHLSSFAVFGGTSIEPQKEKLHKGIDILIATPGRLLDLHKQELLHLDGIEILVLDEADLMLDMGFIDDVQKIVRLCPESKQTILCSATMPAKVTSFAQSILTAPETVAVNPNDLTVKNSEQLLYYVSKKHKISLCLHLLRNTVKGRIIIFRRTKYGVEKLEQTLLKNNYKVTSLHGDKTQNLRQEALASFKRNDVNILVATDVAARGIDISNVDCVLNFDVANDPETYVHRIGRTARAGKKGTAYSFCAAEEKRLLNSIQEFTQEQIEVVGDHPYPLDPTAKPEVHKSTKSKYKKGRKSEASKKKKKRWY